MPNVLTIKFDAHVGLVEREHQLTGAKYIYFFTPNEAGIEFTNAGIGEFLITGGTTYTWEPEPIVVPPTPTSARYKVKLTQGVNVRNGPSTSHAKVGDLDFNDIVVIHNDTSPSPRYLWGKIISIENPTPAQASMMQSSGEKWVAMKDGNTVWLEVIADA